MRKINLISVFVILSICFFCSNARAGEIKIIVNGQELIPDTSPIIYGGSTLVPVRFVAGLCDAGVDWNESIGVAEITRDDLKLEMYTDGTVLKNGQPVSPGVPIAIVDNRLMAPLRFIAETFGLTVNWDSENSAVHIDFPLGSKYSPVPANQTFRTPEGFEITVTGFIYGDTAWNIIRKTSPRLNDNIHKKPDNDNNYVLITLKIKNKASAEARPLLDYAKFKLMGSSKTIYYPSDKEVFLFNYHPNETPYIVLNSYLTRDKEISRSVTWYVPRTEDNFMLIWDADPGSGYDKKTYFKTQ
jgi:hypothetical protein